MCVCVCVTVFLVFVVVVFPSVSRKQEERVCKLRLLSVQCRKVRSLFFPQPVTPAFWRFAPTRVPADCRGEENLSGLT